jgi:hypothetical protein
VQLKREAFPRTDNSARYRISTLNGALFPLPALGVILSFKETSYKSASTGWLCPYWPRLAELFLRADDLRR